MSPKHASIPVSIRELLERGGIHYNIKGKNVESAIKNAVHDIRLPAEIPEKAVTTSLLQREEMMPTAVGKGIAFPHPRNPIISDATSECLALCFLQHKIDYRALDGEPVDILFVIISSNSKRHLEILSKISFLCQQRDFLKLLHDRQNEQAILSYIESRETEWSARQPGGGAQVFSTTDR
jgi:PTS system nitrogen regulatory IIA component